MILLFPNMRQGKISSARTGPETSLSSSECFFRPMVEPSSLSPIARLAENSHKTVGKLPYFLAGQCAQVTVTCSLGCCSACSGGRGPRDSHPVPRSGGKPWQGDPTPQNFCFFRLLSEALGNDTCRSKNALKTDYYSCKKI